MNSSALKTTSSIIFTAVMVAPATITAMEMPSDSLSNHPCIKTVHLPENTQTPKIATMNNKSWTQESQSLFSDISGFTVEEASIYNKAIENLFVPTGRNLFEL